MSEPLRIVLLGNAGVGKTTMAKRILEQRAVPRLSLDTIAWNPDIVRKPHAEARELLLAFIREHPDWIIEGVYSDLIEEALPYCTELRFLNPGVETSIRHCHARPYEPDKFPTPQAQDENLQNLLDWVRQYESRDDEYGLVRHRSLFDAFNGPKREFTSVGDYAV